MSDRVENIGEPGARRRGRHAWLWVATSVVVVVALAATGAPRIYRLVLAIPVGLAALGLLEAREKT